MRSNFYTEVIVKDARFGSPSCISDVDLLEPVTRRKVQSIVDEARKDGLELMVFETYRSEARQRELFNKGYSKLRQVGVHHFGLACDIVRVVNGKPSCDGDFSVVGKLARSEGLIWGGDWIGFNDDYHVQRVALAKQHDLFAGIWYPDASYNPYHQAESFLTLVDEIGPELSTRFEEFHGLDKREIPSLEPVDPTVHVSGGLERGDLGPDVIAWQRFLTREVRANLKPSGLFDEETEEATKALQRREELAVTGKAEAATLARAVVLGYSPPAFVFGNTDTIWNLDRATVLVLSTNRAVSYIARMHICADGAPKSYHPQNTGLDDNANAKGKNGSWNPEVLVMENGVPVTQTSSDPAPGFYVSQTAWPDMPNAGERDARRYLDATRIPYIVLPGGHFGPARLGQPALVRGIMATYPFSQDPRGKAFPAIVGATGPSSELGEASMFVAAKLANQAIYDLGSDPCLFSNPRRKPYGAGSEEPNFQYTIFSDQPCLTWPVSTPNVVQAVRSAMQSLARDPEEMRKVFGEVIPEIQSYD